MNENQRTIINTICVFCNEVCHEDKPLTRLTEKGVCGIENAAAERHENIVVRAGQLVHTQCRKNFCDKKRISTYKNKKTAENNDSVIPSTVLRSSVNVPKSLSSVCLFCGQKAESNPRHSDRVKNDVIKVRSIEFKERITNTCNDRNDDWGLSVLARVNGTVSDLHAADAIYHRICSINFRTGKNIPREFSKSNNECIKAKKPKLAGRPPDSVRNEVFHTVCKYFEEHDEDQLTLKDFADKMEEYLKEYDLEAYTEKHIKHLLLDKYSENIIIGKVSGIENIITFRQTAKTILSKFYQQAKEDNVEKEKERIIHVVAEILKSEIKEQSTPSDTYTNFNNLTVESSLDFLPPSLKILLSAILTGKNMELVVAAVGQALVQAFRPRAIQAPMQLALAIQMHHHFGSRFLIDTLHKLGFCSSYNEVIKFERCAAVQEKHNLMEVPRNAFLSFAADNVDHDICTLDGRGTFHGMGIICAATPKQQKKVLQIPRKEVSIEDVKKVGSIPFHRYNKTLDKKILFSDLSSLKYEETHNITDILWYSSWFFHDRGPSWAGMMQSIHSGRLHPGKADIQFLPMIDHNPTDLSCIYSTLLYVCKEASRFGKTPVITFDQPLYWKTQMIINSEPSDSPLKCVVVLLGGFHIRMSFLGCIGALMEDTGLSEVLQIAYPENTVRHILSGKAVSRAIRAHNMVDCALNVIRLMEIYGIQIDEARQERVDDLNEVEVIFNSLLNETCSLEDVLSYPALKHIAENIETYVKQTDSRTAKLWLQYMDMVSILRKFIVAERTGDWAMHLNSIREMMPYLAAAGHNHYTKSTYIYLQQMTDLGIEHPDIQHEFQEGKFVVRRSDRFWAGLSADLVIEQSLMRSLKSVGGLTHGRGMTESLRAVWVLSMPVSSQVNECMQELTGLTYSTRDQHRDESQSRMCKDATDMKMIIEFLHSCEPFRKGKPLINIVNGMTAAESINVDEAKDIGNQILSKMAGNTADTHTFSKKDKAVTMACKKVISCGKGSFYMEHNVLFQRLLVVATKEEANLEDVLSYEMCSIPFSLFEEHAMLRKTNKASLANALWKMTNPLSCIRNLANCIYVIDGGWLIHQISWPLGGSYEAIFHSYISYVTQHYDKAIIVFDGYTAGPNIKDCTHMRRTKGMSSPEVHFTHEMKLTIKKEVFLRNNKNKEKFIQNLGKELTSAEYQVLYSKGDADVLIAKTALTMSRNEDTCVVGNDTDLLILLLSYPQHNGKDLFFKTEKRIWDINTTKAKLGDMCEHHLLFIHAFLGCDTTSSFFGIGKQVGLKLAQSDDTFKKAASVFSSDNASKEEIEFAGEQAAIRIYKGEGSDTLLSLRKRHFLTKAAVSMVCIRPESLPPTPSALKYHSLRAYLQIRIWRDNSSSMKPEDWGWRLSEGICLPVMTDKKPAPDSILELIRCNCRADCQTFRCVCKKNGQFCTTACGHCMGVSCENTERVDTNSEDDVM